MALLPKRHLVRGHGPQQIVTGTRHLTPKASRLTGFAVYKAHQLCQWPAVFCDDNFLATSDSRKKTGKMRLGFVDIHRRRWHEPISSLVFRLSHTENSWERELDLYFVGG
jgi:hypothetical protein